MTVRELAPSDKTAIMAIEDVPARKSCYIREADANDIDVLIPFALAHWQEMPWRHVPPNEQRIRTIMAWAVSTVGAAAWVFVQGDAVMGTIAMSLSTNIYSGEVMASNIWWYVDPSARGRGGLMLLRVAEEWAREHNAVMSIGVHTDKQRKSLEGLGYHMAEISLQKGRSHVQ